jgi:hypothetical protein
LLAFSAILLAVGARFHTSAFNKTANALAESNLAPFLANGVKVLWLQDSVITNVLAIIFAVCRDQAGNGIRRSAEGMNFRAPCYRRLILGHDGACAPLFLIDNFAADNRHCVLRFQNLGRWNFHDISRQNGEVGKLSNFD